MPRISDSAVTWAAGCGLYCPPHVERCRLQRLGLRSGEGEAQTLRHTRIRIRFRIRIRIRIDRHMIAAPASAGTCLHVSAPAPGGAAASGGAPASGGAVPRAGRLLAGRVLPAACPPSSPSPAPPGTYLRRRRVLSSGAAGYLLYLARSLLWRCQWVTWRYGFAVHRVAEDHVGTYQLPEPALDMGLGQALSSLTGNRWATPDVGHHVAAAVVIHGDQEAIQNTSASRSGGPGSRWW